MFRHGGRRAAVQQLSALPPGSLVQLWFGAVYEKAVTRWNLAGHNGLPLSSQAILDLNAGCAPAVMTPVAVLRDWSIRPGMDLS